jgi:hypothetical protein
MMSPSMPATSVTCVIARLPSLKRAVHDEVEALRHLLADGAHRQVDPAISTIVSTRARASRGAVGVDGADRAVVAGVHRLQHVERRGVPDLTDDDAVGRMRRRCGPGRGS